jgi:serum/glucocorticoid-regulated kinase 2
VRTDDLESVRVERAIKRVRSDLAMHLSAPSPTEVINPLSDLHITSDVESTGDDIDIADNPNVDRDSGVGGLQGQEIKEEEEDEDLLNMREDAKMAELVAGGDANNSTSMLPTPVTMTPVEEKGAVEDTLPPEPSDPPPPQPVEDILPTPSPSPPTPPHPATRIPRSASADPDKASRLSRVWPPEEEAAPATPPRKPKRVSPKPKNRPTRKVVIDDFEMMRVLGKGCAGKVLLVRHRASSSLYALKAITKRHVLAHQELQHTLTEQAVLKRMAHEAKDPFVVKLWWSFHDKENLFLVMDFHPGGDLATQLARWGRLGRDRARFYAAEIVSSHHLTCFLQLLTARRWRALTAYMLPALFTGT